MSTGRVIVVTGAAGFVGSHVAQALLAGGDRVIGIDNFDPFYARTTKERNLAAIRGGAGADGFDFVTMELTDQRALSTLLAGAARAGEQLGGVIHLAGKAGVRPSLADPASYMHANVTATQSVLSAATAAGVPRVVIASSSSVYGNSKTVPFREDDPALEPISPYAASKRAAELLAFTHHHAHGTPVACLRFFTVYGPRQRPDLAISLFMRKMLAGQPLQVFGDGSMARDYTFVSDTVQGVLAALDRIDAHGYRIWNLGNNQPTRLDALLAALTRATGIEPRIERQPQPAGDVERTWADLTRSRAELGYQPRVTLEQGLAAQWEWLRQAQLAGV